MLKKTILFTIIAFALVGCSNVTGKTQDPTPAKQKTVSEVENTKDVAAPAKAIKEVIAENGQVALYTGFTPERYSELFGQKPFVIFFHAAWCSTCVELEKQINKNIKNLPPETIILKADYDTATKLKQDYGVTLQSTVVVIDKTGQVTQSLLGPSIDQLETAISESL